VHLIGYDGGPLKNIFQYSFRRNEENHEKYQSGQPISTADSISVTTTPSRYMEWKMP